MVSSHCGVVPRVVVIRELPNNKTLSSATHSIGSKRREPVENNNIIEHKISCVFKLGR